MLGNNTTQERVFLNIADGKIVQRTDKGLRKYDYLEGVLEKVYSKEREFRGESVPYWYIDLKDRITGDLYSLGMSSNSGVARSLILSLGDSFDIKKPIRIEPYKKGQYNRVSVYSGDKRLDWVSDLPPVEGERDSLERAASLMKRDKFISNLVEKINSRVDVISSSKPKKTRSIKI